MRKPRCFILCLAIILLLGCIAQPCYAELQDDKGRFLYMDIPYENISTEDIERIINDKFGEVIKNEYGGYIIADFGHELGLYIDRRAKSPGIERVLLHRPGEYFGTGEEFETMFNNDILMFVDIEAQLTERYGDPKLRFFNTLGADKKNALFMFEGGLWDAKQIKDVCYDRKYIKAFSQ